MEVHRQTCQACGSIDMRNIIAREEGRAQMVFVRCGKCGELVARYRLRDYYHHGKAMDSFLRSMGPDASDSARQHRDEFNKVKEDSLAGFKQVLDRLRAEGKEV